MRRAQRSFGDGLIAEEVDDLREDWMKYADWILDDETIVAAIYQALGKRHPKSRSRGRRGTPAEVVLRLLIPSMSVTGATRFSSAKCDKGERDGFAEICCVGNVLVGRVSIALHDAMIGIEQLQRVDGAAARRIGVGDGGRVGSTPGPVIAGDRQKYPFLVRPRPGSSTGATVSSTAILSEPRMSSRSRR